MIGCQIHHREVGEMGVDRTHIFHFAFGSYRVLPILILTFSKAFLKCHLMEGLGSGIILLFLGPPTHDPTHDPTPYPHFGYYAGRIMLAFRLCTILTMSTQN